MPLCFPAKFDSCASDETVLHLTGCGAWYGIENFFCKKFYGKVSRHQKQDFEICQ